MSPGARVRFRETVRPRLGRERGFLFDERSGRVYSLNATAALAAACIQRALPVAAVVAAVVDAFDADASTVHRDLARFVDELVDEGLACVEENPGG